MSGASSARSLVLWAGLLFAFSPVLLDTLEHMRENPWARYAAIFPLLFALCVSREPDRPQPRSDGWVWIAAGLAIALVAAFSGSVRHGRLGVLLGAIGLCRRFALASWRSQLLLVLAVPIPAMLLRATSPELPATLLSVAAAPLAAVGADLSVEGTRAAVGRRELWLERSDGGLALVVLCAGLSWYASCRLRRDARKAVVRSAMAALVALPAQVLFIAVALLFLLAGEAPLGRQVLTHAPWIAISVLAVATTEWRAPGPGTS